jgi:hypothetical protein
MPIKELKKKVLIIDNNTTKKEDNVQKFISKGGSIPEEDSPKNTSDRADQFHRLTLRIPKELLECIDNKRKNRLGKISRNLWILKQIEKASEK